MKLNDLIDKRKTAQNRMQALAELVATEDRKLSDDEKHRVQETVKTRS